MQARFHAVFVIFLLMAVLIIAVQLRSSTVRTFYRLRVAEVRQSRLKQNLWQKQLEFENIINPAALSRFSEELKGTKSE